MSAHQYNLLIICAFALCLLCLSPKGRAQSQASTEEPPAATVIKLRCRPKIDGQMKGSGRKRFFLIKGGMKENQGLMEKIERVPNLSRDCYYRSVGASEALIRWLKENDCESVYCREIEARDIEGEHAVPEFQDAFARGVKEFGGRELALKWLTVNLRDEIRSGFYKREQELLRVLIEEAERSSKAKVQSVMTDQNGTAYFTDLKPGTYIISSIIPILIGDKSLHWHCEMKVKPEDAGTERPFLLSTQPDKNVKCVAIERPISPCN